MPLQSVTFFFQIGITNVITNYELRIINYVACFSPEVGITS
ncbi:hypothetical protein FDUTEX481_00109 [Tolypothrix sp. PCC 7601]|nr:hypothetical protein FDUTEX481_00109 [Tolypothrix sp. PCC 7601]